MSESREIKFRLWDKVCKRMVDPDTNNGFRLYLNCSISEDSVWCSQDCVLMQYTGLKDRSGKEIYEGDIVKCYIDISSRIYCGDIVSEAEIVNIGSTSDYRNSYGDKIILINYEVKYGNFDIEIIDDDSNKSFIISCYGWYLKSDDYHCSLSEAGATVVEVIGNIYERPELLKEK